MFPYMIELMHNVIELLSFWLLREAEMREVSEKTNARVAWFSMMSLLVCVVAAVFQLVIEG